MRVLYLILALMVPGVAAHATGEGDATPSLSPRLPQPMAATKSQPQAAPVFVPTCAAPSDWQRGTAGDMQAMQDYARCLRDALETVKSELVRRGLR